MSNINELSLLIESKTNKAIEQVINELSALKKDDNLFSQKDQTGYTLLQKTIMNFNKAEPINGLLLINLLLEKGSDVNAHPYPMLHLIFKHGLTALLTEYKDKLNFKTKDLKGKDAFFYLPRDIAFLMALASIMTQKKISLPLEHYKPLNDISYQYSFTIQYIALLSLLTGFDFSSRRDFDLKKPSEPYYQHLYILSTIKGSPHAGEEFDYSGDDNFYARTRFYAKNSQRLCATELFTKKYYLMDNPEALEIARDILELNKDVLDLHTYAEALKLDHGTAWLIFRHLKNATDLPPDFDITFDPYMKAMEAISHPVPFENIANSILDAIGDMPISENKRKRIEQIENLIFQKLLKTRNSYSHERNTLISYWSRLVKIADKEFPDLISYRRFEALDDGDLWLTLVNLKNVADLPNGYHTAFDPYFSRHMAKHNESTTEIFINDIENRFQSLNEVGKLKLEERFLAVFFGQTFFGNAIQLRARDKNKYIDFFKELSATLFFSKLILIYLNIRNVIPITNNEISDLLKSKDVKITERLKAMPAYDSCMDVLMYLMPEKNQQDLSKKQKDDFNAFFSEPVKNKLLSKFPPIKVDLLYHLIYKDLISDNKLFNALIYTSELKKKLSFFMQKNLFDPHYPLYKNASAPPASVPSTALSTAAPTRKNSSTGQTNPFFAPPPPPPPPTVPPTEVPTAANTQPPIGENSFTAADLAALQNAAKELDQKIQTNQESSSLSNNSSSASQTSGEKTPAKIYPDIPKAVDVPSPKLTTSSTPMNLFSSPSSSPALSHGESVDERIKSLRQTIEDLNTSIRLFTDMDDMESVGQDARKLADATDQYTYFLNLKKSEEKKPPSF